MIWWDVAKKEIRANITSPKVVITYLVCTVLILAAILTGASNYLSLKEEALKQRANERERLANIFNYQQDLLQQGMNLYREPDVLSVIVSGVEGDAARRANVTTFYSAAFDISKFNSNPILAVFGLLDLAFIVKMILSLFAILFTFDAVSGERELGTLKLNLANEVSRSSIIVGKLVGNFLLLFIPFVIPLLIGLLILQFIPGIVFSGEDWTRAGLIFGAFVLYLMAFYSMGIMVSSLTKNSSVSFLVLLMLYVLFIAIVPRISVLAAQNLEPVPSVDEVRKDIIKAYGPLNRAAYANINVLATDFRSEAQRRSPRRPPISNAETEARYEQQKKEFEKWVEERRATFNRAVADYLGDAYEDFREVSDKKIKERRLQQDSQNTIAVSLSRFVSPSASLTFITDRLARTGVYSADEVFRRNVEKLQVVFIQDSLDLLEEHPEYAQFGATQTEAIDVSHLYPDLSLVQDESLNTSVSAILIDYAVLAFFSIVFFALSYIAFMRYDVR